MVKIKAVIGITVLTFAAAGANADPIVFGGTGNSYAVVSGEGTLTWDEAKAAAEALGGHLVTITFAEENDFVADLVNTYGTGDLQRYWLGGYQTDPGTAVCEPGACWEWVTGETWSYENWEVGEPNNGVGGTQHFLHYWRTPGMWDDMENRSLMDSFVVEFEVPEPGTLGLLGLGLLGFAARARKGVAKA